MGAGLKAPKHLGYQRQEDNRCEGSTWVGSGSGVLLGVCLPLSPAMNE